MIRYATAFLASIAGCSVAVAQSDYYLDDASPTGDVEYSTTGKLNWKPVASGGPWGTPQTCLFPSGNPTIQPYGDILSYTGAGVGDVDGDGYGDFAITWYEAQVSTSRIEPCSVGPDPLTFPGTGHKVGFVRVISGNPAYQNSAGISCTDPGGPTWNVAGGVANQDVRRIGPDFWGRSTNALWSHEISSIGDLDGDGKDEVLLTANVGQAGIAEIWSCTNRYRHDVSDAEYVANPPAVRWVKLLEITGESINGVLAEEMGYQAYHGPLPDDYTANGGVSSGYDLDFNNDGAPDLLLASKFFRDSALGHTVNGTGARELAPGAAWLFLMPQSNVFDELHSNRTEHCDTQSNEDGSTVSGGDGITDRLPLRITSEEFNARITGHQVTAFANGVPVLPTSGCRPHGFGHTIDPAGDIDGDGLLDLVVGAPGHIPNADYPPVSPQCDATTQEGQIYFFLSDSNNQLRPTNGNGETITFADLYPKHYISTSGLLKLSWNCDHTDRYVSRLLVRSTQSMQNSRIEFTSEAADFVIAGHTATGTRTGIGNNIEGGVKLDNNDDPDFAFRHHGDVEVLVMLDMRSRITDWIAHPSGGNGSKPTQTALVWTTDPAITYAAFDDPEVGFKRFGGSTAMSYVNWSNSFGGPQGFSLAGNFDGLNGNCELALHCIDSGPSVMKIAKIEATGGTILARIWPEPTGIDFGTEPQFPNGQGFSQYHPSGGSTVAWPIWPSSVAGAHDDARHDLLIGARSFPVLVTDVPGYGPVQPWTGSCTITEGRYNRLAAVPVGRAWVLRSQYLPPLQPWQGEQEQP